jgi:methyltransferase (TIGR00027 family)
MIEARPSRTAMRVATRRAAHQMLDNPRVLEDPIALPIIGAEAGAKLDEEKHRHGNRVAQSFRAFLAVRSRYAEDEMARSVARGAAQYVVLGAGLDTFAYRNPYCESALRVFEVDFPATQEWKRTKLASAGISIPASVTYAPVDFERQTLLDGLQRAGFDVKKPAFFSWLGVVMYLTEQTVMSTLGFIASLPQGGGVVFDYAVPRASLNWMGRIALDALSRRVSAAGEPFQTFFDPSELTEKLTKMGFRSVEDLGADEINSRYFADRTDGLRVRGRIGHLMSAQV